MKTPSSFFETTLDESEGAFEEGPRAALAAPIPPRRSRLWNAAVGMVEKRRAYPSDRAQEEFLDYYSGLYQDRGPSPARFKELLLRNGRPFMANPFPEGSFEHYLYHPEGLVLADLEAILGGLAQDWKDLGRDDKDAGEEMKWPTIDEAIKSQEKRLVEVEREWALQAGVCWGMLVMHPGSLDWLRERVHPDNLAWATVQALNKAPWDTWGVNKSKVLSRALEHRLFSERVANSLFSWRSA